jgi:hypothetical protein
MAREKCEPAVQFSSVFFRRHDGVQKPVAFQMDSATTKPYVLQFGFCGRSPIFVQNEQAGVQQHSFDIPDSASVNVCLCFDRAFDECIVNPNCGC